MSSGQSLPDGHQGSRRDWKELLLLKPFGYEWRNDNELERMDQFMPCHRGKINLTETVKSVAGAAAMEDNRGDVETRVQNLLYSY